jgi:diguanylate cyclase (GGDEF)-like protein
MSSIDATGIRVAVLANYSGVLRRLRSGEFAIQVPTAPDASFEQLGVEIGALAAVLEQKFDEYARLAQISRDMSAGLLLEEVLDRAYESFRGLIPYDRIGCALIDHASWTLRARWARTEAREVVIGVGYEQSLHGSSLEAVVESNEPRILNDLMAYLNEHPTSDSTHRIVREGIRSSLTCPLVARGRPIGFLFFSSLQARAYENVHVDLFSKVAEQLSMVVEKSLLYEKMIELNCQLMAAQRKLEHKAQHDSLTGLPNRGAIVEELDRISARAMRNGSGYGLLMLDIDHFKRINDRYGHLVGDRCLRHVGEALAGSVRAGECIGRFGGEEFLAILDLQGRRELQAAAERFRKAIGEIQVDTTDGPLAITVSVGGALGTATESESIERVLANADSALYAAKASGRNRVVIHPSGSTARH